MIYSSCPECGEPSVAILGDDDKEIDPLECYDCTMKTDKWVKKLNALAMEIDDLAGSVHPLNTLPKE